MPVAGEIAGKAVYFRYFLTMEPFNKTWPDPVKVRNDDNRFSTLSKK